jgi:hypothetical protein
VQIVEDVDIDAWAVVVALAFEIDFAHMEALVAMAEDAEIAVPVVSHVAHQPVNCPNFAIEIVEWVDFVDPLLLDFQHTLHHPHNNNPRRCIHYTLLHILHHIYLLELPSIENPSGLVVGK